MNDTLRMKVCETVCDAPNLPIIRHCKSGHKLQTHQWKTWGIWIDLKVVSYVSIFHVRRDKAKRLLGKVLSKPEERQDIFMIQQAPARGRIPNKLLDETV